MKRFNVTGFMRKLHIYSAMPVLAFMVFFAITGFYLNHPEFESSKVEKSSQTLALPTWSRGLDDWEKNYQRHSLRLLHWLDIEHNIRGVDFNIEWDEFDALLIINLSGPNGSTLVEISTEDQEALVDTRRLSMLATLNNVHRAKHVTGLWRYVSDLSAICMLIFCFTGVWVLIVNKLERKAGVKALSVGSVLFVFVIFLMH